MKEDENKKKDEETFDPNDPKAIIAKAGTTVDDEYDSRKGSDTTYYSIAHTLKESVTEQPKMVAFGKLKEYQVGRRLCDVGVVSWGIDLVRLHCSCD